MTDLRVRLLAGVRIARDGVDRPVTSRRQRAVIAALGLHPGRSVSAGQLIDALWGDDPPRGARATLQTYISRLRSLLGDDAVLHGPAGYRLADGASCDTELARQLADQARSALADAPSRAAQVARRALALWEGPVLGDVATDAWFAPAVAALEELRARLVDTAGDALTRAGAPDQAVELLEPAARAEPLREPRQVRLIEALTAAGRHVDAVRAADRYRHDLAEETGLEPGAELVAAEQRALTGEVRWGGGTHGLLFVGDTTGATLPRAGAMVGRDGAFDSLTAIMATERLVSLCGPGGVGKTRLAAKLVAHQRRSAPVVVVELAPIGPGDVAATVAAALRLRNDRVTVVDIAEHLGGTDVLVVLDNAEHVGDEVRSLARALLDGCPGVRLLITSRIRIGLPDEWIYVLGPLSTVGERSPAAQLFVDRVVRSGGTTAVEPADPIVRAICVRLDGLPLALELAAGRAAALGTVELRDRLDEALNLVVARTGDRRHDSLRRVVGWSYDLLEQPARDLLCALAVFEGDFDLAAAESVGSAALGHPVSLLLARLVDDSLVASTGGTPPRYRLLEMVRQFGREQLDAEGTDRGDGGPGAGGALGRGAEARRVHAEWVCARTSALAEAVGPAERHIAVQLDELRAELRSALRWSSSASSSSDAEVATRLVTAAAGPLLYRPDADLVDTSLAAFRGLLGRTPTDSGRSGNLLAVGARLAFVAGDLDDAETLADQALARSDTDVAARHRAHHARGVCLLYQGRYDDAARSFAAVVDHRSASLVDRLDALGGLGLALCYQGRLDGARRAIEQHGALARTVDSDTYGAFARYMRGELSLALGTADRGVRHLHEAADRAWAVGASFIWGIAATVLAAVLVRDRPASEAREHLPVLLERCRHYGMWTQAWTTMRLVAELLAREGSPEVAALIVVAAQRDRAAPRLAGDDVDRAGALERDLREHLGAAAFEGIVVGATRLTRAQVLARAVDELRRSAD